MRLTERLQKYSLRAIFLFLIDKSVYPFCQQSGICRRRRWQAHSVLSHGGHERSASLSCFLSYANQYTKPFNEISGVVTELQNALACAARIFELIEEEAADSGCRRTQLYCIRM